MNKPTIIGAGVALVALVTLLFLGPRPAPNPDEPTGDTSLAQALKDASNGHGELSAFTIKDGDVTYGGVGADHATEVEIGSVTKTFIYDLARKQVDTGQLTWDTEIGSILDLGNSEAATITVEELVQHTSGLPRLINMNPFSSMWDVISGNNPYANDTTELILDAARTAELSKRGEKAYSNFGYGLLGLVVAQNAGMSLDELLQQEIFQPLGMDNTYLALPGTVSADAPRGITGTGREAAPWEMHEGQAGAGAIRSTAEDMVKYAQYMLDEGNFELGWPEIDDSHGFWHNGGTGGYRTALYLDPETRTASWVSSATNKGTEPIALQLLNRAREGA